MKRTYGVALIGCGHMGEEHLKGIYCKKNLKMVCACDIDQDRARQFKRQFGFKRVTADAAECINAPDVDIVIIATYPSTHLQFLKLCLANQKHVLCEKPLCANETDAAEFVRLVKAHPQCKVLVGLILRHSEAYRRIAEMIRNNALGSPVLFRMVQNHHTIDWPRYLTLIGETSPIIDCGVHYLDVMQWFTGAKITDITGIARCTEADVPAGKYNYGLITAQLSDGSAGFYEAGWGRSISSENRKEFIGPLGSIRLIQQNERPFHQEEGSLIEYYNSQTKHYQMINIPGARKPTGEQFNHLIGMIEEDIPAVPTIDEVFEGFRLALAADRAILNQRKERIDPI